MKKIYKRIKINGVLCSEGDTKCAFLECFKARAGVWCECKKPKNAKRCLDETGNHIYIAK